MLEQILQYKHRCLDFLRSNRFYFLLLFVTFILYLLATNNGNNTNADSLYYRAIAENLAIKQAYVDPTGAFILYWPPLYSLILAFAYPNIDVFVLFFHGLCLIGVLLVWRKIAREFLDEAWVKIFLGLLALSTPLLMLSVFVWSEILFTLLFSLYLLFVCKFLQRPNHGRILWLAALFAWLMMLQRNAGIFLFIGVQLGILVNYSLLTRRNILNLIIHQLLAVSGFAAWNVYVVIIRGNLHIPGELLPFIAFERNFVLTFRELGLNIVPNLLPPLITALLGLGMVLLTTWSVCRHRNQHPALSMLLVTLAVYLCLWVIVPADMDRISRFVGVVLPVFYLLMVFSMRSLYHKYPKLQVSVSIGLVLWGIYSFVRILHNVALWGALS